MSMQCQQKTAVERRRRLFAAENAVNHLFVFRRLSGFALMCQEANTAIRRDIVNRSILCSTVLHQFGINVFKHL